MQIFPDCQNLQQIFLDCVKLIEYLAFAVTVVSSNPCLGPSFRTKIFFLYFQRGQMSSYQHQK